MTLQELQAELQALALAYPPTTKVHIVVPSHCFSQDVFLVRVDSTTEDIVIYLEA